MDYTEYPDERSFIYIFHLIVILFLLSFFLFSELLLLF